MGRVLTRKRGLPHPEPLAEELDRYEAYQLRSSEYRGFIFQRVPMLFRLLRELLFDGVVKSPNNNGSRQKPPPLARCGPGTQSKGPPPIGR